MPNVLRAMLFGILVAGASLASCGKKDEPTCEPASCHELGLECGPDPICGHSCGECEEGYECNEAGVCVEDDCEPDCEGRECGPDPICGHSCGECEEGYECNEAAVCVDLGGQCEAGDEVTFSFDIIPFSAPEIANPFRGSYEWLGTSIDPPGWPVVDSYRRWTWRQLEPERDVYDFSIIDHQLELAEARGGTFGLRVMSACTGCGSGMSNSMPDYMHDLMPNGWWFDYSGTSNYAPDWNDPDYLDRLARLLEAIADRYDDDPRFGFFDISGYGDWSEWHVWQWPYPGPTGATDITDENAIAIVDLNFATFSNTRLVMPHDHRVALAHAMNLSPRIGVRNDCVGTNWFTNANEQEEHMIGERWKTAPYITEYCNVSPGSGAFERAVDQVKRFHVAMLGNGNIGGNQPDAWNSFSDTEQEAFMEAKKSIGYRFEPRDVSVSGQISSGCPIEVRTQWANVGVTPAYTPWDVTFEVRSDGDTLWSGISDLDLEALLPTTDSETGVETLVEVVDAFWLPGDLSPGEHDLVLIARDRNEYYPPLSLAVEGRSEDGSYSLGTLTVE